MSSTRIGLVLFVLAAGTFAAAEADRLTSRPLPKSTDDKLLKAGETLTTAAGEQKRLRLPDRSLVYVRQGTTLSLKQDSTLEVARGEVFVETASGKLGPSITVQTPKRTVQGRESRFGVRVGEDGTGVVVASGSVKVSDIDAPVRGGQQLSEKSQKPARAGRVSHLVAWTRELRNAAPLVPDSEHGGGTLVAREPDGQEAKLELRRYHIDVHIEDGFARTTIDQTYFNHSLDRIEGTFRFPLPPDASLSRLAMYVDGTLMEGGMAERDHARAVYERIVYEKKDPALLEWVDGSTFKMRVFPLEARQEKRILLSYTQRLPVLYAQQSYRFPAGHTMSQVGQWSLAVRVKGGADMAWQCDSHTLKPRIEGGDLSLDASAKNARLDRDIVLRLTEKQSDEVRFSTMKQDGASYLMVRYRPELSAPREPVAKDWVVLMETSGDREPLLMRTQIELLRAFLSNAGREDSVAVLTGSTRAKVLRKSMRNDLIAAEEIAAELEKSHLVGAFDLGAALSEARPLLESAKNPYLVHIGSGIPAMGERRPQELLKKLPKGARYVGVGVGKRWDRALMQTMAEKTGGYFTQVNPDEPIGWRGLELASTLDTPRLLDVVVSDPSDKVKFLPFVRMTSQGEEVAAVARVAGPMPARVRITGALDGQPFSRDLEVKPAQSEAAHLPRSWAKLEIDRLLAEDAGYYKKQIVELSKAMYVMTPFTSLLVLENDDMYKQFNVDRGRKDHWAMYAAPRKIPVVVEPLGGDEGDPRKGIKPTWNKVLESVVLRGTPGDVNKPRKQAEFQQWYETVRLTGGDESKKRLGQNREEMYDRQSLGTPLQSFQAGRLVTIQNDTLGGNAFRGLERDEKRLDPTLAPRILTAKQERAGRRGFGDGTRLADPNPELGLDGRLPLNYNLDSIQPVSGGGVAGVAPEPLSQLGVLVIRASTPAPVGQVRTEINAPVMERLSVASADVLQRAADSEKLGVLIDDTAERQRRSPLYARPSYTAHDRQFFDLLADAPDMHTSRADILAVLDAEARPNLHIKPGRIDAKAKALLDDARKPKWRTLTVPAGGLSPSYVITFDGTGKYAWERTLPSGLKESVICDGKTLLSLYPELGLAARRSISRHHRLALASRVPALVPAVEDLARGVDVTLVNDTTVGLVPHGAKDAKKHVELHLVFEKGAIVERRLMEMPAKKVLSREAVSRIGSWKIFDGDNKVLFTIESKVADADAPSLKADTEKLVVLDLPYRTHVHTRKALRIEGKATADLTFAEATQLMAAFATEGQGGQAQEVFTNALARRDQRQIGYYVLLASAGVNLDSDNIDVLDAHPHEPLAHYLSLHSSPTLRKHASRWAASSNVWGEGFLRRLGMGHALTQRWASGRALGTTINQRRAERGRALDYIRQHKGTGLAWALFGLMLDRTSEESNSEERKRGYLELAKASELFADTAYASLARYERARCLWRGGDADAARTEFVALYREARKAGGLLRLDSDFRAALVGAKKDGWSDLLRETARELVDKKDRGSVLLLASQVHQLDDRALSQNLFNQAIKDVPVKGDENLLLYAAAIGFLTHTQQRDEADRLVNLLLADADHAKKPALWRAAADLATAREQPARALECREKALTLEFADLPDTINLEQVRADYRGLLTSYGELTRSLATLKLPAPAGFRDRVLRAADRWRAMDREQAESCRLAAEVLRTLGERELAFDYLTTPVGLNPGESEVWLGMANELVRQGERDLADRAYQSAFERESTNAQILFDRADNLRRAGRSVAAKALYQQIAEGDWQPRFATLKSQAKWMLE